MGTLIVLIPPRDSVPSKQEGQLPQLPFLLLDKAGRTQQVGHASLALLPLTSQTVLMIAARDVLMVTVTMPPLKGHRLRQALPNVVEEHLIQDPQHCHFALDPQPLPDGRQIVAVIDYAWFRFILETFRAAGHRNVRAVPVTRCLLAAVAISPSAVAPSIVSAAQLSNVTVPVAGCCSYAMTVANTTGISIATSAKSASLDAAVSDNLAASATLIEPQVVIAMLDTTVQIQPKKIFTDSANVENVALNSISRVELAIVHGVRSEGFSIMMESISATIAALSSNAPIMLYILTNLPGEAKTTSVEALLSIPDAQPLSFEMLAHSALHCSFNLCQFEFIVQPWLLDRATLRYLRLPLTLVLASIAVSIIGVNIQWLMLTRQRDTLSAQMTETLLNAFPKTTIVFDAATQMSNQLQQLRIVAGELSPDDFLSLVNAFAHSLGPVPANGIIAIDYHDRKLNIKFKPEIKLDSDFYRRLERNRLAGTIDINTGKWTIRNA